MKRRLFEAVLLLALSAALLRADYASSPLDSAVTQQPPYKYAGIIISTWDATTGDGAWGSGTVVGNPKIVISCAHVPYDTVTMTWVTDNLWFRAYESSVLPIRASGQVLRGYWKFASYADMVSTRGRTSLEAFAVDFTAFYGYENLGPGSAGFWYDGQAALVSPASKIIVGYPAGLYPDGDPRQNMMHQAGPFNLAFSQTRDSYNKVEHVTTGEGNSGGPVFVTNEASMTDADQGLRFAAVLVAGGTDSNNASISGVVAVTAPEWDLVNDSLDAIGATPINDAWSAALTIFGDTVTSAASNRNATKESGEPNHAGNAGGHSVWWRWTAPGDGPVTINTLGSGFDTLLGVYAGGSLGSLTAVASNDDSGGVTTSAVTFTAAAGTEYWIAVDGKNGATGTATVNLNFAPTSAPANDAFANATVISGLSAHVIGNNINATKEPGEPDFVYTDGSGMTTPGGKSVWWKWTAPGNGQVFLTTSGTDFDSLLSVYTGTAVNALTFVASDDDPIDTDNDSSTLTFSATSGTTYWISVDGCPTPTSTVPSGAISLSLNLTPTMPMIAVQPAAQTPNIGDAVTLAVAVRSAGALTYQWYKDGAPIYGATGAAYTISSFQVTDAGNYTVVVSNSSGSVTSNIAALTPRGYPVITNQPVSQVVYGGATVTFTVAASSTTTLSYQWKKEGVNLANGGRISGATGATLTISNAQTSDAGSYLVVVTNSIASVTSASATLTVIPVLTSGGIVAISARGDDTFLVGSDGSLWAVGDNTYGQLGDGTTVSKSRPVQVATGVATASAGGYHSLFLKSDGTLWGMGYNICGQLGGGGNPLFIQDPIQIAAGVVAASAGGWHSLFIKADGTLWAMGSNGYGQLGDGTVTDRSTPVQVASGVIAASAGGAHSLFIKSDGSLWAVGDNEFGQLGDGTTTNCTTPVRIGSGVIGTSAGGSHSLFIKSDGTLWAAGYNSYGQLGDGTMTNRNAPVKVTGGVTAAGAGGEHSLFLKTDGTLWAMGANYAGQLGDGTTTDRYSPVQVINSVTVGSAGAEHSIYLRTDGTVWAMGNNSAGQLGDGTNMNRLSPVPMIAGTALPPGAPAGLAASVGTVVNAVRLSWNPTVGAVRYQIWRSSSNNFSGATLIAGNVASAIYYDRTVTSGTTYYYWVKAANQAGAGGVSNAGSGHSVPWIAPAIDTQPAGQTVNCGEHAAFTMTASGDPVPSLQWQRAPAGSSTWSDLAESDTYAGVTGATLSVNGPTYAMKGDRFRCVASNTGGQAFSNAATLTVNAVAGVVSVSAGGIHSLFVRADGALWGMGNNYFGQLGDGTVTNRLMPVKLATGVVMVSAGSSHSLFIKSDGTLWGMGNNSSGQLGDGTTTNRSSPVQIATDVVAASAGGDHSLFIKADGTLWTIGNNNYGQLGDGTNTNRVSPVQVASGVVKASAGRRQSLFVRSDGTLWAMGHNQDGELGDGTFLDRATPVQVAAGVAIASAGDFHGLFVKSDGTLWAMGGNNTNGSNPVQIATGVVAASDGDHSLFIKSDGTLWAMGGNNYGQLGDGTNTNRSNPVQVTSGVVAASASSYQSLFAKADGTLWAMGYNYYGQLGDGTLTDRWTPVQVGGGLPQLWGAPTGLTASQGTVSCAVLLSWNPVVGASHYEVWRNTSNTIAGASLITGNVVSPIFGDFTAAGATSYYYWVKAVNFAGASDFSGSDSGFIPLIPPVVATQPDAQVVVSGQSASFTTTATGSPAPSYQWQRSVNGGNDWTNLANGTTYSGVTTATLAVSNVTTAMRGHQFRCVINNGVGSSVTSPAILTVDPALVVTTLAGHAGYSGGADGIGNAALFNYPKGVAADSSGVLYVADTYNHTIRKVTPAGVVTTLAGTAGFSGSTDGTGTAAQFLYPAGVAIYGAGGLCVADTNNNTIREVTPEGVVTTLAGTAGYGGSADGTGSAAQFSHPQGVATDGAGNVYVADMYNNAVRKVTSAGAVTTLAGLLGSVGGADGTGSAARFDCPQGLAMNNAGDLFVTEFYNYAVRKITPAGVVSTLAGTMSAWGSTDGMGSAARFYQLGGVAVDNAGNAYVADSANNTVRKLTPAGMVTTIAGLAGISGSADGTGSAARFVGLTGIAVDQAGNIYVADTFNSTIRKGVLQVVPLLTGQPSNETAAAGGNARFAVGLSGWSPANCQWQRSTDGGATWSDLANDGTDSGVAAAVLTITNVTAGMNGWQYRCRVSSGVQATETSSAATLTIGTLPSITAEPASQGAMVGGSAHFKIAASGNPAPVYKWQVSTDSGVSWSNVTAGGMNPGYIGATMDSLTVSSVTFAMNGYRYRCVATNAAGSVPSDTATLTVNRTVPVLTWPAPAAIAYGTALSGAQLDATANVPGTFVYSPAAGAMLNAGAQTLHVTFTPADATDYTTASGTQKLTVNKAVPVITWPAPAAITYPTPLSGAQLNATASVPGTFVYSPATGTVLTSNIRTLSVKFTPTDTTDYANAAATQKLTVNKAVPVISWPVPTAITYGTPLSATQLNATANVLGAFVYTPAAGKVLTAGTQTLSVKFTPTDTTDYATATATKTLTVNKAVPVITWPVPAAITYGTPLSSAQLNATASVPGTFVYSPEAGTVLTANIRTLTVKFTPTDATDYANASATQKLTVNKAVPVISWPVPAAITYPTPLSVAQLNATASVPGTFVYTPAAVKVLTAGTQTLSVKFTPTDTTDYATATATQKLTVSKAVPVITWPAPAAITYPTPLSSAQLNATASVPGTFVYSPAAGTVLTANIRSLSVKFTPTDATDYTNAAATQKLTVNKAVAVITWPTPAAITYPTPLSSAQLNATANVPGAFVYTPAAGKILTAGTQTLNVKFTPTDTTDYATATATQKLTVNKAVSVITWPTPAAITYPTPLSSAQLNATASVPGTFVYSPAAGTVMTANVRTLSVKFTPTDATDYTTAAATQKLTVNKAVPVITWPTPAAITYPTPLSSAQLNATANVPGAFVYTPAAGIVLTVGAHTLSVKFTPTDTTDYTSVTATRTLTVASAESQAFLQLLFKDVLGREVGAGELSSFSVALAGGESQAAVLGDLLGSTEYSRRQIEPAIRLYYAALGRPPEFTDLQNWSGALRAGVLTLADAADQLAGSTEFLQDYGALNNTQYVQQLYRNLLGREADAASLAGWLDWLDAGASRGSVVAELSESEEFKGNVADQVEILRLHFLLLHRMPTAAELQNWQDFLLGGDEADNAVSAESDPDYWTKYFTTLDDQMRDDLLADPAFSNGG